MNDYLTKFKHVRTGQRMEYEKREHCPKTTPLLLLLLAMFFLAITACARRTTPSQEATKVAQDKATMVALATAIKKEQSTPSPKPTAPPTLASSLAPHPTATLAQGQVSQTSQPHMNLLPIAVEITPLKEGWQQVTAEFALENDSDGWYLYSVPSLKAIYLTTAEGYTYEATRGAIRSSGHIPPGFTVQGGYQLQFQVAEGTHGYKVVIPSYEATNEIGSVQRSTEAIEVDLEKVGTPAYPFERSKADLLQLGTLVELPSLASVSIDHARMAANGLVIAYSLKNLSGGYETTIRLVASVVGNDGLVVPARVQSDGVLTMPPGKALGGSMLVEVIQPGHYFLLLSVDCAGGKPPVAPRHEAVYLGEFPSAREVWLRQLYDMALAAEESEEWYEAARFLAPVVKLDPGYKDAASRLAEARKRTGSLALETGDGLHLVSVDGEAAKKVLSNRTGSDWAISSDGSRIAWTSSVWTPVSEEEYVYVADGNGYNIGVLTSYPLWTEPRGLGLSPDGKLLALHSRSPTGRGRVLSIIDIASTQRRDVECPARDAYSRLVWAPDGQQIFLWYHLDPEIWVYDVQTNEWQRLATANSYGAVTISLDGSQAYGCQAGIYFGPVVRINLDGTGETPLDLRTQGRGLGEVAWCSVSPDGKMLAIVGGRGVGTGRDRVFIASAAGGKAVKIGISSGPVTWISSQLPPNTFADQEEQLIREIEEHVREALAGRLEACDSLDTGQLSGYFSGEALEFYLKEIAELQAKGHRFEGKLEDLSFWHDETKLIDSTHARVETKETYSGRTVTLEGELLEAVLAKTRTFWTFLEKVGGRWLIVRRQYPPW